MLSSGLDIENFKPIKARNKDDMTAYYAATLCQANKDWNSSYAQRLARDGTQEIRLPVSTLEQVITP